jgi:4-amino-4-deoxy-L-arabinose transferase-like glycosyltransferase
MEKILKKNYKIIIFSALLFMLVVSVLNAKNESAIFDETAHIPAGYSYLKERDMRLNPEHPPLIKALSAVPLMFLHLNFDTSQKFWTEDINGQWDAGKSLLWESDNDPDQIVFWSRLPIVLLSLLLGWLIFKWTRELAGTVAGIFALILYTFNPNILGHNHFVTTDIGIATFMALSFYYFLRFIKYPTWKNVWIGGFFLGLLQLAKFSSVLLFPIFGLVLVFFPLIAKENNDLHLNLRLRLKKLGEYLGKGSIAFVISLALVWVVYAATGFNTPKDQLSATINYYFEPSDQNTKSIYTRKTLLFLNESSITRPMSEYGLGIGMVFKRVAGGNGAYFMGQVSSSAFPSYFPIVYLIKEPLPVLFFVALALGITLFIFIRFSIKFFRKTYKNMLLTCLEYTRNHITELSLFSFIILYSYISITGNLNIGLRHLFPIFPFIYILTAQSIIESIRAIKPKDIRIFTAATVIIFSLLLIGQTVCAYPYYMSYFNALAGGSKNGYNYVTDSNADWGQDLIRLQKFLNEHPEINKIRVDYFGGGNPSYYLGEKFIPLWDSKRPIETGWYAISTNFLQGSIYSSENNYKNSYKWLKNKKPLYQVGTSILIYHVAKAEAEKVNNFK